MASKVMIFIDGSNFMGSCREFDPKISVDFEKLSAALVKAAKGDPDSYQGTYYYASLPPTVLIRTDEDRGHLAKQHGFLQAMEYKTGYTVKSSTRKVRTAECEHCHTQTTFSVEKGVDSSIVADMMSLGWEDTYDAAVLISNDADLKPAIEYLKRFGKKVIHASFASLGKGADIRKACFSAINLEDILADIRGPKRTVA
jgi:uncharacterized LabA/DUF88 family protein